jgi:hypothetical protein
VPGQSDTHEAGIAPFSVLACRLPLTDRPHCRITGATAKRIHMRNKAEQIRTMQLEEAIRMLNKEVHSRRTVDSNSMAEELRMGHTVS